MIDQPTREIVSASYGFDHRKNVFTCLKTGAAAEMTNSLRLLIDGRFFDAQVCRDTLRRKR